MSEINIDASLVEGEVSLNRSEEKMVEMSNGCICCTLREDLLLEVSALAKADKFDYLVIESTGISEPLPVAETFTFEDENGLSLSDVARLDTMVTVVDGGNFLTDFRQAKSLQEAGESLGDEDERSVADLLIDQVEFADVLLISKTDLMTHDQIEELRAILHSLNPQADIHTLQHGKIPLETVLNTQNSISKKPNKRRAGCRKCAANTCRKPKNTASAVLPSPPANRFTRSSSTVF